LLDEGIAARTKAAAAATDFDSIHAAAAEALAAIAGAAAEAGVGATTAGAPSGSGALASRAAGVENRGRLVQVGATRQPLRGLSRGLSLRAVVWLWRPLARFRTGGPSRIPTADVDVWAGTPGGRIASGTSPALVAPVIEAVAELAP
jgi:hypothetical protein